MNKKILFWTPRVLVILYILFLSLFALDVFSGGYGFFEMIVALFMHLFPSLVLVGILVYSWKKEKIGGYIFLIMGVVFTFFFDTYEDIISFLIISGPVFLVGGLFLLSYNKNRKEKKKVLLSIKNKPVKRKKKK